MNDIIKIGLTVNEAAAYSGIGSNTLRRLVKDGRIPALTIGRKVVIRRDTLDAFMTVNTGINLLETEKVKRVNNPYVYAMS